MLQTSKETLLTYYLPSKFRSHSFDILGVKGGRNSPPPPGPQRPKNQGPKKLAGPGKNVRD